DTLAKGCWSDQQFFSTADAGSGKGSDADKAAERDWFVALKTAGGSAFDVLYRGELQGQVSWQLCGLHNVSNALAAVAAARHVGVAPSLACEALSAFRGVKRRMEVLYSEDGVTVYDDFAHHPTAIATSLEGLRNSFPDDRIVAVIEPRSNTMKLGVHGHTLGQSTALADEVLWFQPEGLNWSLAESVQGSPVPSAVVTDLDDLVIKTVASANAGTRIVIMSNGGFGGFHQKLVGALSQS
ncbi:MAG: glutamate ligase domain-containing protein, partial [bacterium]